MSYTPHPTTLQVQSRNAADSQNNRTNESRRHNAHASVSAATKTRGPLPPASRHSPQIDRWR